MAYFTMITRHGVTKDKISAFTLISDQYQTVTMPELELARAIASGKIKVTNLKVDGTKIVATNGAMDKYTFISTQSGCVEGVAKAVILDRVEQKGKLVGYTVFNQYGQIMELPVKDAVAIAIKNGISNGKIRHTQDGDIVSSINGNYPLRTIEVNQAPECKVTAEVLFCTALVKSGKAVKYGGVIVTSDSAVTISKLSEHLKRDNAKVKEEVKALGGKIDALAMRRIGATGVYAIVKIDTLNTLLSKTEAKVKDARILTSVIDGEASFEESVAVVTSDKTAVVSKGSPAGDKAVEKFADDIKEKFGKIIK